VKSKWLDWTPGPEIIGKTADPKPTKPTKLGFDGFDGSPSADFPIIRAPKPSPVHDYERRLVPQPPSAPAGIGTILRYGGSCAPNQCPALPLGVRMVRYEPKSPPVSIDVCSVVVDVEKFIRTELRELDARLHAPTQIRGGWGVFTILDRLRQVGLELEIGATIEKVQTDPDAHPKSHQRDFGTPRGEGDTL
jgi:hypothetical protein